MEKNDANIACRATNTTPAPQNESEVQTPSLDPFCEGPCQICESGFAPDINTHRTTKTLRELSAFLETEYGLDFSKDQLARHFKKYGLKLRSEAMKIAYQQFHDDANMVATHTKQTLFLAQTTFQEILNRMSNGTMKLEIGDYEKLLKLYYQILQSPETAPQQGLVETFMLAQRRWDIPITQQSMPFTQNVESAGVERQPPRE